MAGPHAREARDIRWTVRPGDGPTVREVLARAGADPDAVSEGRVFVGRVRVRRADHAVRPGDQVSVAPARPASEAPLPAPVILARGADFVAVDKPAGIPTIPDHGGASHALLALTAAAIGVEPARLHPTSRLDREVSGVVVFALTHAGAERLARARAEGRYERRYVAVAVVAPSPARGTWEAPIGRAADPRLRAVAGRDPVEARTHYAAIATAPGGACLLALAPVTGRTHQLRVHAAHAGAPLFGDRAYGGPRRVALPSGRVVEPGRVALHAARVVVPSPDGPAGATLALTSPVPPALESLWSALGGEPAAWEGALACVLPSSLPPPSPSR